ncbi:protein of unknown function DUF928 [Leptolyngbyaceae cyanobacterium JSC-12]|nr:protein of unknown function DUF928 [Leptolyngbyaceae cyanobacterium JSC-12]
MKFIFQSVVFGSVGMAIALGSLSLFQPITSAQLRPVHIAQRTPGVVYVRREVSGPAPSGRYRGGGSRTVGGQAVCPATALPLTAIVPFEEIYEPGRENRPPLVNVWGYTTFERPTFWVYVPYSNPAIPAKLSIDDEDAGRTIYEESVTLPNQPGIISLTLPRTAPALQPGKRYRWYFALECKSATAASTDNINITAIVIRDRLPAAAQLTAKPSIENARLYAQNGFWYDALTTLAKLRLQRPQDPELTRSWQELLAGITNSDKSKQNFNLEQIASQPLVK